MKETDTILKQFKEKVCEQIYLETKGVSKFFVNTPFTFEDGDGFTIFLYYDNKKKKWILSDEGHTFMHLSYFMNDEDMTSGTRQAIIENNKKMFGISENDGELFLEIEENNFGDALYSFIQSLMKIADITYLSRERAKSTFLEDFRTSISAFAEKNSIIPKFDYYIAQDKAKKYNIDCFIEFKGKSVFIFAIDTENKAMQSMLNILILEKMNVKFHSVGVYEDQTELTKKTIAKSSDVFEKQISSLDNMEYFEKYMESISE
ncbi:MAG TPA: DUF1828 domain-containing protein [Candidatus Nanoarchaeia archaeon]|nr:DUF1828 domain-containing protein [Candidatus Nanoarchaeia archaeon]